MSENKQKIIVVTGPTGVGKSAYGVELALRYNGEIVGADSVQIYRGFNIGSGKITEAEMCGVPHHLIDIAEPYENFTVVDFVCMANDAITDILNRGKTPIVVGGTGFYINALIHGYSCGHSGPDAFLRDKLKALESDRSGHLYEMLERIDPAVNINKNDTVRIIRRLELLLTPQDMKDETANFNDTYDALLIVLDADRKILDDYADKRIRGMLANGFADEVRSLKNYVNCRAFGSVGYREVLRCIKNGLPITEEVIEEIKLSYHALIKKQQTFFKWIKWNQKVFSYNGDRKAADAAVDSFVKQS